MYSVYIIPDVGDNQATAHAHGALGWLLGKPRPLCDWEILDSGTPEADSQL